MEPARPLRDVFDDLVGQPASDRDPASVLRDSGHADLPDALLGEAIVRYADTAPVEVAEHLAPFVTAHSPVPPADTGGDPPDPGGGLDLLAATPPPGLEPDLLPETGPGDLDPAAGMVASLPGAPGPEPSFGTGDGGTGAGGFAFGAGDPGAGTTASNADLAGDATAAFDGLDPAPTALDPDPVDQLLAGDGFGRGDDTGSGSGSGVAATGEDQPPYGGEDAT